MKGFIYEFPPSIGADVFYSYVFSENFSIPSLEYCDSFQFVFEESKPYVQRKVVNSYKNILVHICYNLRKDILLSPYGRARMVELLVCWIPYMSEPSLFLLSILCIIDEDLVLVKRLFRNLLRVFRI